MRFGGARNTLPAALLSTIQPWRVPRTTEQDRGETRELCYSITSGRVCSTQEHMHTIQGLDELAIYILHTHQAGYSTDTLLLQDLWVKRSLLYGIRWG